VSSIPRWLNELIDRVAQALEPHTVSGPLGVRYHRDREDGAWEIAVFPCLVESLGGEEAKRSGCPGFFLDIQWLQSGFDEIVDVYWNTHGAGSQDQDGPFLAVEGRYEGHDVFLRVLAQAPDDELADDKFTIIEAPSRSVH
jgi:hypothetical protein